MYLYLELWSAREAWLKLSRSEREAYFDRVSGAVAEMTASGLELVAFAINDDDTDERADYEYLSLFRMPDRAMAIEFEKMIDELGWYDLFHQENMRGPDITDAEGSAHMLGR